MIVEPPPIKIAYCVELIISIDMEIFYGTICKVGWWKKTAIR